MTSAKDFLPPKLSLSSMRQAASHCKGCPLYKDATQVVFGEGPINANLVVVGEIPGDKEDQIGKPFVGPAGTLLRNTIKDAKIDDEEVYFTNAVKHFKFIYKNTKRLHRSPVTSEVKACHPWLEAELKIINPHIILCLGSVAAKILIDKNFRITVQRGKWFHFGEDKKILVTFHPSAILRTPDQTARHQMKKLFANDIKKVTKLLRSL